MNSVYLILVRSAKISFSSKDIKNPKLFESSNMTIESCLQSRYDHNVGSTCCRPPVFTTLDLFIRDSSCSHDHRYSNGKVFLSQDE